MKNILKKPVMKVFLGLIIGGVLGFAYYKIVGCRSGTCPITSNPYSSIVYGSVMGSLFTYSNKNKRKK